MGGIAQERAKSDGSIRCPPLALRCVRLKCQRDRSAHDTQRFRKTISPEEKIRIQLSKIVRMATSRPWFWLGDRQSYLHSGCFFATGCRWLLRRGMRLLLRLQLLLLLLRPAVGVVGMVIGSKGYQHTPPPTRTTIATVLSMVVLAAAPMVVTLGAILQRQWGCCSSRAPTSYVRRR